MVGRSKWLAGVVGVDSIILANRSLQALNAMIIDVSALIPSGADYHGGGKVDGVQFSSQESTWNRTFPRGPCIGKN